MVESRDVYDAVVVGGGPAGLTAALYLARARYRVLVLERERFGGQIAITSEVVNYPGVLKASGGELTATMRRQAELFGAEFALAEVVGLDLEGDVKTVRTTRGDIACLGVLLATGARPRRAGFAGEEEFLGRGIAYCATCDGEFFAGKEVFVVGGGYAAAEESVFLTRYAEHVTVLVRRDGFSCAPSVAEGVLGNPKITVLTNTEVQEVGGAQALQFLRYRNTLTGEVCEYRAPAGDTFGLFVFAGYTPVTELVDGKVELTAAGYVATNDWCETSVPGLYAAGDVCEKGLRQVATATGEAALAASSMERYLDAARGRTGLAPAAPAPGSDAASALGPSDASGAAPTAAAAPGPFDADVLAQLDAVFDRMRQPLVLRLFLDDRPVSAELRTYMEALAALTDKLAVEVAAMSEAPEGEALLPSVHICRADGAPAGLAFHGVPGGHEFTSFVLGLYNVSGPGQPLDDGMASAIMAIARPVHLSVLVSLSCTMCPDTVAAANRVAALNPNVTVDVYDLAHFPQLRERRGVMSVPCLVVEDEAGERLSFGRKSLVQLLELIG